MENSNSGGSRRALRALILEDNPLDAELTVAVLKQAGYPLRFEVVALPEQFQAQLEEADYDLILADYNLRTWTAMEALAILKKSAKDLPFVVITGTLGDEAAVECIKQGASDYVLKHRLQRLPVVVDRTLRDKAHREEAARLQEQIHQAKKEWELTFDAVPDSVFLLDEHYHIQRANRAAAEALRLPFSQLVGRPCYEVVHGQDAPPQNCPYRQMLSTGKEESADIELPKLGRIFHATSSPFRDPSGGLQGCVHVLRDITERKQAEMTLRRSEASYRSLILGATYGIFRSSLDGKFLTVNPALAAMLGYGSEAELLGANLLGDISQDADAGAELLQQYRRNSRIDGVEAQWRRKDGKGLRVRLSGRAVLDEQGTLEGFEVIAEDVTQRQRLEEQLRQAQKLESIGRLAGGIAHDFNNLLTIINGYGQLLLGRADLGDPMHSHLSEIMKAGERAASLIRQLLTFSRRQVLSPQVLDLNAVISNMDKMLCRLIGEDIDLVIVLGPDLGRVKVDRGQIEQVVLNLAVNARDAMPQGGKLTLETVNAELDEAYARCHVTTAPGRYVMLAVSDTGVGMDAETRAHAFEPFFTTKEGGKGTGLGLATVYGIVKQSGGHIWVYSEPGQGTTFKIYFPRVEEAVAPREVQELQAALLRGVETILLVEDDEAVRPLVRAVLGSHGYTVLEASRGEDALATCQHHAGPIHLLLTDVVMPGMSGGELAKRLATLYPQMKTLYMSGYANGGIAHRGVLEPDAAFLQKPFTPDALARKVAEVLNGACPQNSCSAAHTPRFRS
jgi:PAS domain S-box-containing protein